MTKEERHELMLEISRRCEWSGNAVCQLFIEVLTDCNFHSLRKKIVPINNKELKTTFHLNG